jgi:large subunit ribosomal protein L4
MPSAPILGSSKTVDLDDAAWAADFHEALVHECVRADLNARRQGTHSTKTRGTVFGPQPRRYTFKINRKERRVAFRSALSLHGNRGSVAVLDAAPFAEAPSTKQAASLLGGWDQRPGVLVVLSEAEAQVALSFRNLWRTSVLDASGVGVADLVGASALLASQAAIDELTQRALGTKNTVAEAA